MVRENPACYEGTSRPHYCYYYQRYKESMHPVRIITTNQCGGNSPPRATFTSFYVGWVKARALPRGVWSRCASVVRFTHSTRTHCLPCWACKIWSPKHVVSISGLYLNPVRLIEEKESDLGIWRQMFRVSLCLPPRHCLRSFRPITLKTLLWVEM